MAEQLVLIEAGAPEWRLDERTRELGRRGVAEARRILAELGARERDAAEREPAA